MGEQGNARGAAPEPRSRAMPLKIPLLPRSARRGRHNQMEISFVPCGWRDISQLVAERLRKRQAIVESFWEGHVLEANHYLLGCENQTAGHFAIHGKELLVLFDVLPPFARASQEIFARVKNYETVKAALVHTGDSFLLSHCLDSFARMEKQGYLAVYDEPGPNDPKHAEELVLRRAMMPEAKDTLLRCGDFFTPEEIARLEAKEGPAASSMEVYLAARGGVDVGVGVVEPGKILPENASIGMFVHEAFRHQGNARLILRGLQALCRERGLAPTSGCWYYNHNSKKSLEAAGAHCPQRLIRFEF